MTSKAWMGSLAVAGMLASGVAQATLVDRGGGLIYDTTLNITWLQNADLGATERFGVTLSFPNSGLMEWPTANAWIQAMNTTDYLGYSNWRLPTALNQDGSGPCDGFNCTNSELGHLFYIDGALPNYWEFSMSATLTSLFTNMHDGAWYWSGTAYDDPQIAPTAWGFQSDGYQHPLVQGNFLYVWAVRDGDVSGGATVPEPATLALVLAGFGLAGLARRGRSSGVS